MQRKPNHPKGENNARRNYEDLTRKEIDLGETSMTNTQTTLLGTPIPLCAPKPIEIETKELGFTLSDECRKDIHKIEEFIRTSPHRARMYYFD